MRLDLDTDVIIYVNKEQEVGQWFRQSTPDPGYFWTINDTTALPVYNVAYCVWSLKIRLPANAHLSAVAQMVSLCIMCMCVPVMLIKADIQESGGMWPSVLLLNNIISITEAKRKAETDGGT